MTDVQAKYLAKQIIAGSLDYDEVIAKRPEAKEQIDKFIAELTPADTVVTE